MPSHTVASALVQMFYSAKGAPWTYEKFKAITGVSHGLFPEDDNELPHGWSREMTDHVHSYFQQYKQKPNEHAKILFSAARKNGHEIPGRDIYRRFITELWCTCNMHDRIIKVLSAEGLHPIMLAMNEEEGWIHDKNEAGSGLPAADTYLPLAVDPVVKALFGDEALDRSGRAPLKIRPTTQALIQRTWTNIRTQVRRNLGKVEVVEEAARAAFKGD